MTADSLAILASRGSVDKSGGDAGWGRGCDRESAHLDEKRYLIDSCLRLMGKRWRVIWLKGKERLGARCKT